MNLDQVPIGPKRVLGYFTYSHLPAHLHPICKEFRELAVSVSRRFPQSPELECTLRDLLRARDSAVRMVEF